MPLVKRFWVVYALLMVCAIWYAVHAITRQEIIVLPYDNAEDIAMYKRVDTMKQLSDHEKQLCKLTLVALRKKSETVLKKWVMQFKLQLLFDSTANEIMALACKNMPDEIINYELTYPSVYSNTFSTDIGNFSRHVDQRALHTKAFIYKTVLINPDKILYKYYYCKQHGKVYNPVGQINMLFDNCVSSSRCTNIKVLSAQEMDKVYVGPPSLRDQLKN